jgi:hypothetical protein
MLKNIPERSLRKQSPKNNRPSNGHSNLATLYDLSTDYQATRNLTLSLYLGYADGGDVIKSIYRSTDLTYGYFEATLHF